MKNYIYLVRHSLHLFYYIYIYFYYITYTHLDMLKLDDWRVSLITSGGEVERERD